MLGSPRVEVLVKAVFRGLLLLAACWLPGCSGLDADASFVSAVAGESQPGTAARPLRRPKPRYPEEYLRLGYEGWVDVSFVVKTDGSVADLTVEDSTSGLFEPLALDAVSRWTYRPARLEGRAVEQAYTSSTIVFAAEPIQAPSRSFIQTYQDVRAQLVDGRIAPAERRIAELALSEGLNLRERSYVFVMDAALRQKKGEDERQLRSLQRATILSGRFLDAEAYATALSTLFVLRIQRQEIRRALDILAELERVGTPPPALIDAAKLARERVQSDAPIGRAGRIPTTPEIEAGEADRIWNHSPMRPELQFQDIAGGTLQTVDFRCSRRRRVDSIAADKSWRIPRGWGSCVVFVSGTPGTTFTLVEYAGAPTSAERSSDDAR